MTMTNEDIIREYREAKTPLKQIGILADENMCSRGKIVEILREAGMDLPAVYREKNAGAVPHPSPAGDTEEARARREAAGPIARDFPKGKVGTGEHPAEETEEVPEAGYGPILPAPKLIEITERVKDAAVEVIARMVADSDSSGDQDSATWEFRERVRGVLALVHELRGGYGE